MSDMWEGATWNENGELVIDVYANPPKIEPEITADKTDDEIDEGWEDDFDEEYDEDEVEHTYATINCGGDCGGCVALIVDDEVISGPPFHPNCRCTLNAEDIENAHYHDSHLHQDVARDRNVDTHDVEWLKKALTKLGYYEPDTRAGESKKQLNQYPNQRLFNAIDKFRKEKKIKENGAIKPGHWTEVKINEELKQQQEPYRYKGNTFDAKVDIKDGQYAVFDGQKLTVYDGDNTILFWNAVSGKDGFQTPEYQDQKNKGPIPKGTYVARQRELQHRSDYNIIKRHTSWPGGESSWGNSRVWLEPSKETNTFGRDGFSIHGGATPGSAGCIDLTFGMDGFTDWFKNNGHDLIINVEY